MRASYQMFTPPEKRRPDVRRACTALATILAMAGAIPGAAWAQDSVNDYQLPPSPAPTPSRAPAPAGPADPENPLATRPSPAPTAAPPLITPSPAPTSAPSPRATQPAAPPRPRPTATATPTPRAEATPEPAATASEPASQAVPTDVPVAAPPVEIPSAAPLPEPAATADNDHFPAWAYWGGGLAALLAFAAIALTLRRRNARSADAEPIATEYDPEPEPESLITPEPAAPAALPDVRPAAAVPPAPAAAPQPIGPTLHFEPGAMRMSLVYATLKYRIDLSGTDLQAPLRILGDMIGAHSSLDSRAQLAPDPAGLVILHDVSEIPPEGSLSLNGELRIPLEAIRPIHKGGSLFFVPLARFCVIGADGLETRRVFTIGPPGAGPAEPLSPILLNGPGQISTLAAREIEMARSLALDPVRVAG